MMFSDVVEVIIIVWFTVYIAERIPMVIRLCKALKFSFYRKRLEAAKQQLQDKLEDAKHKAEMDWTVSGGKIAEEYVDRMINESIMDILTITYRRFVRRTWRSSGTSTHTSSPV